jgi:TonB family protein
VTWSRRGLLPLLFGGLVACAAREPTPTATREPAPSAEWSTWPLDDRRYSLFNSKLSLPPLPPPASESGARDPVPLNTSDPRYAEYVAELKRRFEDKGTYPSEASRKGQSGEGEVRFVLHKDGSVRTVEIARSSGVPVLDRHIENAIRMTQPFPPIPAAVGDDVLRISLNFNYVLKGAP